MLPWIFLIVLLVLVRLVWYRLHSTTLYKTHFDMDNLPDELVLLIISYLDPRDAVSLQQVSCRFKRLGRDNQLWKDICFERSAAASSRRRNLLSQSDIRLEQLARAMDSLARPFDDVPGLDAFNAETLPYRQSRKIDLRTHWDPSYPGEQLNFYQEYIHRHAPIQISWLQGVTNPFQQGYHEAVGMGLLFGEGRCVAEKAVAPLDDGSVAIWDVSNRLGNIIDRSASALLCPQDRRADSQTAFSRSHAVMTHTGAVECVSIDSKENKAFIAVKEVLYEVDLQTLQVSGQSHFPHLITALSEASNHIPITVGTNETIHLHDRRQRIVATGSGTVKCELIGGGYRQAHTLLQPGPLSILHMPISSDCHGIWVAGRFTNILNFDRRKFPAVRGTVHSGARMSCITAIPHPFVPDQVRRLNRVLDRAAMEEYKSFPGHTLVAAGEYKLKGSLELYSLSSEKSRSVVSTTGPQVYFKNRQTASSSKLLSIAPHGGCLVFSDGDGRLVWVERDGTSPVRQYNINDGNERVNLASGEMPRVVMQNEEDDIVRKIAPTALSSQSGNGNVPIGQDNLIILTGNGRLGMVGFGKSHETPGFGECAETESEEYMSQERAYDMEIRRALERQAAELRWMRSYGL